MEGKRDLRETASLYGTVSSLNSSALCHPPKLAFKAYYFFFYAAIGSSFPYLMLFFKQLGLNAAQAGILSGVKLFSEAIGGPLWGTIGEKFRIRKIILFASLVSFSSGILLFMPFPPRNQECIETRANATEIRIPLSFTTGQMRYEEESMADGGYFNYTGQTNYTRRIDETEMSKIFTTFLIITISSQIVGSVVFNMPDALVVGYLQGGISTFGYYRVWGEVGVATGSFVVGGVINFYQLEVCGEIAKKYFISFYFFAGFFLLAMFNLIFLKATYPERDANDSNLWLLVKELMRLQNAMFMVVACFLGILVGMHEYFGLWYLDDLGAQPYM
ncbi:major facilitator superfamily domain-containing protein 6-like, partial [Stylophora pistillata]|uniref:major facilitator superfamily domain-containing protein 6-like n=1 Tax=Stylophora pistillata TaxID=50429 RepID=UPI000C04EC5C